MEEKKHTWKSTKHRFKAVPHQQYISRFLHYIEQHGTRREKMQVIDNFVYDKFEEARENVLSVHEHALKRWALQKDAEDSMLDFKASKNWLESFRHRHNICSRKMTKIVTRHRMANPDTINASADSFIAEVKGEMSHYTSEEIINTDQAGIELDENSLAQRRKCYCSTRKIKKCHNTFLHHSTDDNSCRSTSWTYLYLLKGAAGKDE